MLPVARRGRNALARGSPGMQKAQRALANGDREGPLRYGSFVWPDYCVISRITGLSGTETTMLFAAVTLVPAALVTG